MVQILTQGSTPVFLGNSGVGPGGGGDGTLKAAPIRELEAFYTEPLVVGFHVVGSEDEEEDS